MINISLNSFCPQCSDMMRTSYLSEDLKVERCIHCNIGKRINLHTNKVEFIVPPEYEISDKQKNFILTICSKLNINFEGVTKNQATEFIKSNIKKFESAYRDDQLGDYDEYIFVDY